MLQQTKLKYDNELNIGVPSNMAVPNCNFNVLKSHDKEFLSQIQPQNISGYTYLNKLSSNNSDFHPVKYGKKIGYTSADPRLLIKIGQASLSCAIYAQLEKDTTLSTSGIVFSIYFNI